MVRGAPAGRTRSAPFWRCAAQKRVQLPAQRKCGWMGDEEGQEMDNWQEYERRKAGLRELELSPEEYEKRLLEITDELGI